MDRQIYVACLAAYNNGRLHGKWIDATQDADSIWDEINAMLKDSPEPDAEEWAIHDHEGLGNFVTESTSMETIHALAEFLEEYPDFGESLLDECGGDLEEAKEAAENYAGTYESLADYAQEITEECGDIPDHLQHYIDYERMAKDMEYNGDYITIEEGYKKVHIFHR